MLRKIEHDLEHLNIQHATIQMEKTDHQHDNSVLCTIKIKPSVHHNHHH